MRKYNVESRRLFTEDFDNLVGDYIEADSAYEAIELYKQWLIENGCFPDEVEEYEYIASEV